MRQGEREVGALTSSVYNINIFRMENSYLETSKNLKEPGRKRVKEDKESFQIGYNAL